MDFEKVFKALGDPLRLKILELLPVSPSLRSFRDGCNVNQLVEKLNGTQPNISHHLKILKDAGIVRQEKVRNNIYYYKNQEVLCQAQEFLKNIGE